MQCMAMLQYALLMTTCMLSHPVMQAYESAQSAVKQLDAGLATTGCAVVSDGWTDTVNRPLLNYLYVAPSGVRYLYHKDTSGAEKTAEYIADVTSEAIEIIGPDNVTVFVTDSAAVNKAAGALLEAKYKKLFWLRCIAHCADLLLHDVGRLSFAKRIISQAKQIIKFIKNHHWSAALVRAVSKEGSKLSLLLPGETRFATSVIMLERLLKMREDIGDAVAHATWRSRAQKRQYKEKAAMVKRAIQCSEFWDKAEAVVAICQPILSLLRLADGNQPCMGRCTCTCCSWRGMLRLCKQTSTYHQLPSASCGALSANGGGFFTVRCTALPSSWTLVTGKLFRFYATSQAPHHSTLLSSQFLPCFAASRKTGQGRS